MRIDRYTAEWCGPCQMLAPVIEELEEETGVQVNVIDIDKFPEVAKLDNVRSVPTLIFKTDKGDEIDRVVGLLPKPELEKKILEYK